MVIKIGYSHSRIIIYNNIVLNIITTGVKRLAPLNKR